jgi:choline dehydrogenase-like flavoprotein
MTRAGGVVPVHGELRRRADHGRRDIANTIFHPVGTTKMGRDDDPMAVVDSRLRIRGMPGVRIVDAGVTSRAATPTRPPR